MGLDLKNKQTDSCVLYLVFMKTFNFATRVLVLNILLPIFVNDRKTLQRNFQLLVSYFCRNKVCLIDKTRCFYFCTSQPDTLKVAPADLTAAVVASSASQTGAATGEQDAVRSLASPVLLRLLRHPTSRRWWLVRRDRPSHLTAGSALE